MAQLAAKNICENRLGYIVAGRPEAASAYHNIGLCHSAYYGAVYILRAVANGAYTAHIEAAGGKSRRYGRGVGIGHATDKNLVANYNDRCFHTANLGKIFLKRSICADFYIFLFFKEGPNQSLAP